MSYRTFLNVIAATLTFIFLVCIHLYYNIESLPITTVPAVQRENHALEKNTEFSEKGFAVGRPSNSDEISSGDNTGPYVIIIFSKAEHNHELQEKFRTTVRSMLRFARGPLKLYTLGNAGSEHVAKKIVMEERGLYAHRQFQMEHLDIDNLIKPVQHTIVLMLGYFSNETRAYYFDPLFYFSLVSHRVLPNMQKVVMLDADLKFNTDIGELFKLFNEFDENNIIGIARECQPMYRHDFRAYRSKHHGTRVGQPPPDGLTGFNSGVLLLDLDKMRKSTVFNSLLTTDAVHALTTEYMYRGYLGDQDFYTLISLDHEDLFYTLPCNWNRQLCTDWWDREGQIYTDVFFQYFSCEGHIYIYHGNCNTSIPRLEWEED